MATSPAADSWYLIVRGKVGVYIDEISSDVVPSQEGTSANELEQHDVHDGTEAVNPLETGFLHSPGKETRLCG